MDISFIRSSSYNCFDICETQYYITYVLGWEQKSVSKAAVKGTIVHKIMEILGKCKVANQNKKYTINDDIVGKLRFSKQKYLLNSFVESLIEPVFNYYNKKEKAKLINKDLTDIIKWVYTVIEYKRFDPRYLNILKTEQHFEIEIKKDWAKLNDGSYLAIKGNIDMILDHQDYYEMVDYKTGKRNLFTEKFPRRKEFNDFLQDFQSDLYFYAIRHLYPEQKHILITIYYINDGGEVTTTRCDDDIIKIENKIQNKFEKIKRCNKPTKKGDRNYFFCKNICSFGKNFIGDKTECEYITQHLYELGMDQATSSLQKDGFNIDFYEKPG